MWESQSKFAWTYFKNRETFKVILWRLCGDCEKYSNPGLDVVEKEHKQVEAPIEKRQSLDAYMSNNKTSATVESVATKVTQNQPIVPENSEELDYTFVS